jgi:hypothetical protein
MLINSEHILIGKTEIFICWKFYFNSYIIIIIIIIIIFIFIVYLQAPTRNFPFYSIIKSLL